MDKDKEVVQEIFSKFFQVGFFNQQYYEIVVTNKRILFIWMGESYKPWMLRIDPGMDRREELKKLDVNKIANYHPNNILINYEDIDFIRLKPRTLFKNGYIYIKSKNFDAKLYNKSKKVDYNNILTIFEKRLKGKVFLE